MRTIRAIDGLQTVIFDSANYEALVLKHGALLRHRNSGNECYFQPGDDANAFIAEIEALDALPLACREAMFDMICGEYL